MPMVRIELHKGRTTEQKAACAKEIVRAIQQHLNAPPEATQVVFVDVEKSDWMLGATLLPK
ncbi:MAG TPA: tautomerase family protein [Burkholderiaceae bacterium]|nr:tautomerase family protein [Burkholderiaceae bacterium]